MILGEGAGLLYLLAIGLGLVLAFCAEVLAERSGRDGSLWGDALSGLVTAIAIGPSLIVAGIFIALPVLMGAAVVVAIVAAILE